MPEFELTEEQRIFLNATGWKEMASGGWRRGMEYIEPYSAKIIADWWVKGKSA